IEKPFGIGELLARIRVALRQAEPAMPAARSGPQTFGSVVLDRERREVCRDGRPIHLTPKEYDLLLLLADNAGRVVNHALALQRIWGPAHSADAQYLRVLVAQLRSKLDSGNEPSLITNESGVGYRLRT
ncbi:MAG: response regulator transcription factor, partial [Burkholderiales bacterium]